MIGLRAFFVILLLGVVGMRCASAIAAPGTGLLGDYFNDRFLSVQVLSREDPAVDFDWGGGSADPLIAPDNFSVRWSGKIRPEFSETHTFYVTADDGVRLWINGQTVVDAWLDQPPTQWTGSIALTADQLADIQVEYYENGGGALVRVEWASASQPRQVVPQGRLYPPPTGNLNPQVDLLSPLPGAVFTDPPSILLAANALDLDGDIARVDFFANGTKIGQATTPPFEFAWSDMDPISYVLYARAVDNDGGVSISGEVSITVILAGPFGLRAEYFNNMDLTPPAALQRLDPRIDFDWGGGSPDPAIFFDGFSARWTGRITPRYSETYTFAVLVDDGARLWIDGVPVIDTWIDQAPTRHEGFITLTANQAYDIEMEFYENGGGAVAKLYWSSPSQSLEIVPAVRLQPPGPGNRRPRAPRITEPFVDGQLVNFADVHMETAPFSDSNPGDIHVCSDFEIWTAGLGERAWVTACIGGIEKLHTHLGDGIFENSHAGRSELFPDRDYVQRIRHRDSSGESATEWSPWAERLFRTTTALDPIPGQPGWIVQPGYKVELVATGFQLPVNIAFLPNPGSQPSDPPFYVAELYGEIKVVSRDGTISDYASGLLNFNPTGAFPGSGEQGLAGLVVEPNSGDLFVSLLYSAIPGVEAAPHNPKIVRFHSVDGGRTAATQTVVLDMSGETQGQSHQISNLSLGPDGKLYVHMGDGFDASTAQDLNRFRGKILRLNLDGSAPTDNPFYNAADGIGPADYVFALGLRNPFGGAWRASDGQHYSVENGPSIDRFAQIVPGRNYLWDGSDASMFNYAIYNWIPAAAPVNLAFVEPGRFGGSGFPPAKFDHAYVSESGPTWASGPQFNGKRISEFILDSAGNLSAGPIPLVEYNGPGKATVVALAAGPDGLYFSDFYKDRNYTSPIDRGANVLRVRWAGINQPPIAVADSAERRPADLLRIRVDKLLANDIDPDRDTIQLDGVNPLSLGGGNVILDSGWLVYIPPAGPPAKDQVEYEISDGRGGKAIGTLFIGLDTSQEGPALTLVGITVLPGNGVEIEFAAIPRRTYKIEFTDSLGTSATWTFLGSPTAGPTGILTIHDPTATSISRFYRVIPSP